MCKKRERDNCVEGIPAHVEPGYWGLTSCPSILISHASRGCQAREHEPSPQGGHLSSNKS